MMNIDGIGEETATLLYRSGLAKDPADLYSLTYDQLATLPGFGEKSAERILDGLRASLSVPFDRVLYALSVPNVGETGAKKIARAAGSIDRLMSMSEAELTAIEDVGPRIAAGIVDYFSRPEVRSLVERLRAAGLKMEMDVDTSTPRSEILAGKQIVISGTFSHNSRDRYKELIELNGGKNVGSISKKTSFILAGENMGPAKLEKASRLGVPIMEEDSFLRLINQPENNQ